MIRNNKLCSSHLLLSNCNVCRWLTIFICQSVYIRCHTRLNCRNNISWQWIFSSLINNLVQSWQWCFISGHSCVTYKCVEKPYSTSHNLDQNTNTQWHYVPQCGTHTSIIQTWWNNERMLKKMWKGERGAVVRILASGAWGPGFKSRLGKTCWDFHSEIKMLKLTGIICRSNFKQPLSPMLHLVFGKWTMREFRPSEGTLSRTSVPCRIGEPYLYM